MIKDELLDELYKLKRFEVSVDVLDYMSKTAVKLNHVLALVEQLDELEKVVVPQWFDEWYLLMKSQHFNDRYIITQLSPVFFHDTYPDYRKRNDHFNKKEWAYITENFMAMIDAVKDGYEIEKEPLYYAKIKGHELIDTEPILDDDTGKDVSEWNRNIYFIQQLNKKIVIDMKDSGLRGAKHFMTIKEWAELGINEANAEFTEVEE